MCCQIVSVLPFSVSSTFLALLVNPDLCFAYSYVLRVLWKVCCPANTFPAHSLSGVCLTLTHQYASISLLSLSLFLLSLLPSHPATSLAAAQFLFSSGVLLAFVVSVLPTISSLYRPLDIYSPCPPPVSLLLFSVILTHLFFLLSLLLSSPVLYRTALFFCSVLHSFLSPSLHTSSFFSLPHRTPKVFAQKNTINRGLMEVFLLIGSAHLSAVSL